MDLELDGTAALVTGSTRGLGKETAMSLVREGTDVVVNGRDGTRLERAVAEVGAAGAGDVVGVQGDLTDAEDVQHLVDRTVEEFDRLDHLVVCGGGPPPRELLNTDDEDFYEAFDLLVMSVARLIRSAAPHLKADDGGSIVIVSSIGVKEPLDWHVLTSSVRIGAVGMGKSLAQELAPDVRVNSVLPGPHETERFQELHEDLVEQGSFDSYEDAVANTTEDVPLDRVGTPSEFADTVTFLCSPRAGNINGVNLPLDGGSAKGLF
jgi:3-oxoacyl-[acyl-carrier protein] reductase